ncbi:MAG: hypothetical protein NT175_04190 [Bacteroidetes bacterium]|nr:hypothetical protein [Bacteroidota bacterium]
MQFKPRNEISLRHFFSSSYTSEILKIEYFGPVLNEVDGIESSPDCLVLDKRRIPYNLRRCEFKFIPTNSLDYRDNGRFDVAIVWDLPHNLTKENLLQQLRVQNGCQEVIVLREMRKFDSLPDYIIPQNVNFLNIQKLIEFLQIRDFDAAYSAYLIAKMYPNNFNSERLIIHLVNRFQRIADMDAKGRGNAVGRFIMTRPAIIEWMNRKYYRWNANYQPDIAIHTIAQLINEKFHENVPNNDVIDEII